MKYYIHYVPGRMRIESPVLHDNTAKAKEFETFIKGFNGISAIEIHAATGSAIIHFEEKKINCEQIIGILEKHGYFNLSRAETCDEVIEKTTEKVLEVAEKVVTDSLGGGILEE
jgi:copper chaperone CopZ